MLKEYNFRLATENDSLKIVELLILCLGDSPTRSVEYWDWKHNKNYFGKSFVLLAFDEDILIGVRAFMRWDWKNKKIKYNCVRAVDTVTHPDYQRQGLFTKLTLDLLNNFINQKIDFIFNTPNLNSLPGNIKMGWRELGRMDLYIRIRSPLGVIKNRVQFSKFKENQVLSMHKSYEKIISIDSLISKKNNFDYLSKDIDCSYLKWRYVDCPAYNYGFSAIKNNEDLIVFRVLKKRKLRELRICDVFITNKTSNKDFRDTVKKLLKDYCCDVATLSIGANKELKKLSRESNFYYMGNKGLIFTLRNVNVDVVDYLNYEAWGWSSGDIEIF